MRLKIAVSVVQFRPWAPFYSTKSSSFFGGRRPLRLISLLGARRGCIAAFRPPSPVSLDPETFRLGAVPNDRTTYWPRKSASGGTSNGSRGPPRIITNSSQLDSISTERSPRSTTCTGLPSNLSAISAFSTTLSAMMRRRRPPTLNSATRSASANDFSRFSLPTGLPMIFVQKPAVVFRWIDAPPPPISGMLFGQ